MYRVYCDSLLLYSETLEDLKIFVPKITLEQNKVGEFTFTIYPNHPYYDFVKKLKPIITVYQNDYLLFRGRIINDEIGFHNEKHVVCESELAFLVDSVQRPFTFSGTIVGLFSLLLSSHNNQVSDVQKIEAGNCDLTDEIEVSEREYQNTLASLQKLILERTTAYITFRHENGTTYMDLMSEISLLSPQTIEFAKNLLDLKRKRHGDEIATVLIPLGAKILDAQGRETEERLTIKSVNGGLDYISNPEAVNLYGQISKTEIWDDVTLANNLLTRGRAYLASMSNLTESMELSAADLATVDADFDSFHIGTYVRVTSSPHAINQLLLVDRLEISLLDPAANKLTLGKTISTFTESAIGTKGEKGEQGLQGIAGADGQDGADGVGVASITEQYYLSTSATAQSGGSWQNTVPSWIDGRYMWTRSIINYTNGTSSTTSPVCVTGGRGATGQAGVSITSVDVWYYQSTSSTVLIGGSWQTTAPAWIDGRFFWEKTVVTYSNGTAAESEPVCITGQRGQVGATGATGPQGAKGDKGDTGAAGENGKDAAIQSATEPSDKSYMWLDISSEPAILKRYNQTAGQWEIVSDTETLANTVVLLEESLNSQISKTADEILLQVSSEYYLQSDANALIQSTETRFNQNSEEFEFQFTKFSADIESVTTGTDTQFQTISNYIRFINGNIILGEEGNQLTLRIEKSRISFLEDGVEVAFLSNNKLFITDAQFINSLQIGNFAFYPRDNGNLSFKKIAASDTASIVGLALVDTAVTG